MFTIPILFLWENIALISNWHGNLPTILRFFKFCRIIFNFIHLPSSCEFLNIKTAISLTELVIFRPKHWVDLCSICFTKKLRHTTENDKAEPCRCSFSRPRWKAAGKCAITAFVFAEVDLTLISWSCLWVCFFCTTTIADLDNRSGLPVSSHNMFGSFPKPVLPLLYPLLSSVCLFVKQLVCILLRLPPPSVAISFTL